MVTKTGGIRHEGVTCLELEKHLADKVSDNGNEEIKGKMQWGP